MKGEKGMDQEKTTKEYLEGTLEYGACVYCGQVFQMETSGECTEEQLNRWATEKCDCSAAKTDRRKAAKEENARNNIEKLFRENYPEAADLMRMAVHPVMQQKIAAITVDTGQGIKGSVKLTNKGFIRIEKNVSKKVSLEE